ncbi:MAG: flagellar motor switch protein FliM [Clostridiales bacterium]|jgi:flagellar motor switch protein FliM|nr:flagellar motor switch protein FliM [Clostridiales bacterium]
MGDILSQSEIDALLNSLSSGSAASSGLLGDPKAKKTVDYDFARPSKFNKEQLKTLEIIFENYARMVSSFLTGYLRTTTNIEVANAELLTYNDFNASISNPVILAVVELSPLKGLIILDLSANIGYSIIDRILGGPGLALEKLRDFSEIEVILLERLVSQMLVYLIEPWESITNIQPKLMRLETNSQFAQIISPGEMIALVTLNIKVGSVEGYMNFCLPHYCMEPIMDRLNTGYRFGYISEEADDTFKETLESRLERAMIPVSVTIGRTNVSVGEFIGLQVGDIIPLDSYYTSDMDVLVGNLLKFRAKPGVSKGKNAIQITTLVRKEE